MISPLKYWNEYYKKSPLNKIPSQFAVFALGEFLEINNFKDLGCGDGRDSIFFAQHGKNVFGIDSSNIAIRNCMKRSESLTSCNINFKSASLTDHGSHEEILKLMYEFNISNSTVLYSRFFLHAITENEQDVFFQCLRNILNEVNGYIALEFRTTRDKEQKKVTESHYRRFIDPLSLISSIHKYGLKLDYFVEGFGLAKFKDDDAHVARCILKLNQ